jgi:hypothetical protein
MNCGVCAREQLRQLPTHPGHVGGGVGRLGGKLVNAKNGCVTRVIRKA